MGASDAISALLYERGVLRKFLSGALTVTAAGVLTITSARNKEFRQSVASGDISGVYSSLSPVTLLGRVTLTSFVALYAVLVLLTLRLYLKAIKLPTYLVDFQVFKPPEHLKVSQEYSLEGFRQIQVFNEESMAFMEKILKNSGISEYTYVPKGFKDRDISLSACMDEAETVIFQVVDELFKKTGIDPKSIDVVITTATIFAPTPSLGSLVMNRCQMRNDVMAYSIAGQGCSSGVVCVELASKLLQAMPEKRVLLVAHENITSAIYLGNNRSYLLSNCMFRIGGAAVILSNRRCDRKTAKYSLQHMVRVHNAGNDDAYSVISMREDEEGIKGIRLTKSVVPVAGRAIKTCLTRVAPLVLPLSEVAKVVNNKRYMPNFGLAFEHFLLHTGGKAVIDEVAKVLNLPVTSAAPARETLYRFGNTCVASTYYILANIETKKGVKKGERIMQLGFGTGFKCLAGAWLALRDVKEAHPAWGPDVGLPGPIA